MAATSRGSVLETHVGPNVVSEPVSSPPESYTYYHAGPLFSVGDLHTNTLLSMEIRKASAAKFIPVVPQDLEQRDTSPQSIRDQDIRSLLSCDLALFTYDGTELDSGTVVEYMVAKFADIPSVLLRTDFRGSDRASGDQGPGGDPWNLMTSSWPRTEKVIVNGMAAYKTGLTAAVEHGDEGSQASFNSGVSMLESVAKDVVQAFDTVLQVPPRLPRELRDTVYHWIALMAGLRDGGDQVNVQQMLQICKEKETKGLL